MLPRKSVVIENNRYLMEIRRGISLEKDTFIPKKSILASQHINIIEIRKSFVKSLVVTILLYVSKTATLEQQKCGRRKMTSMRLCETKPNLKMLKPVNQQ